MQMEKPRLLALLSSFTDKRILVIGDCMLDEYLWGQVNRISPEAPVQVVELRETSYAAGGASNVAANVVAMAGQASIVAVVGDDGMADRLRSELERSGVDHSGLVTHPKRPTTVKTRIIAHNQQVLRVDREERGRVTAEVAEQLVESARRGLETADAVVFSDYSKGVLTEGVVSRITALADQAGKPVFANPKPASISYYRGLSLLSLNQTEAETVTGTSLGEMDEMETAGNRLLTLCESEAAVITLGSRGLVLFERGKPGRHLPVVSLEVYDPCGCGDSAIAAATLARSAGGDWVEAAAVANLAGNAKVRKLGVVPVNRKEIERVWAISHALNNGSPLPAELR